MNDKEQEKPATVKEKIDGLGIRIGNCEQGIESILTNHLPSIEKKVDKAVFRASINIAAQIAILLAILGIIVVLARGQ